MTPNRGDWKRVSKASPCPICGRPDWCLTVGPEHDPTAAICARVESTNRRGDAGWLHPLRADDRDDWRRERRRFIAIPTPASTDSIGFEALAIRYEQALRPERLEALARSLGLSAASLRGLSVGWGAEHRAFAFPMRGSDGLARGIRLRRPDGGKFAIKGGREGLFLPSGMTAGGRLAITEGPTDCAALLDCGLSAVGRPSCSGGVALLVDLTRRLRPEEVAIFADADSPGRRGAETLAAVLLAYARAVRLIFPPDGLKDVRAWRCAGATHDDVTAAIEAAPVRRLTITASKAGRRGGR